MPKWLPKSTTNQRKFAPGPLAPQRRLRFWQDAFHQQCTFSPALHLICSTSFFSFFYADYLHPPYPPRVQFHAFWGMGFSPFFANFSIFVRIHFWRDFWRIWDPFLAPFSWIFMFSASLCRARFLHVFLYNVQSFLDRYFLPDVRFTFVKLMISLNRPLPKMMGNQ